METIFTIDKHYDKKAVWQMLHGCDPSRKESRAKSMGLSKDELEHILSMKKFNDKDSFLNELIESRYKTNEDLLNNAVTSYQFAWNDINNLFYPEVKRITGHKWRYDKYFVILSPINVGISSRKGNKVIRSCFEDPYKQRRITAHELLMTHIWNIFDKEFKNAKLAESSLWALNEVTTVAVLSLELPLNEIWGNNYASYLKNYPQLNNLKAELKHVYLTKPGFIEYLKESIKIVKNCNF